MTRVELQYDVAQALTDLDLERLSRLTSVYGMIGITLRSDLSGMMVEYDASRLNPEGVDRVLKGSGLPVKRTQ